MEQSSENRVAELISIANEEGITITEGSEQSLRQSVAVFGDPSAIFLRDSGNYAARFEKDGRHVTLEFHGPCQISGVSLASPPKP